MAWSYDNRIKVQTTSTGTGNLTPSATAANCYGFSTLASGTKFYYDLVSGTDNEIGCGTWNGTAIVRDRVLKSTNSNAAISCSGTSTIAVTIIGEAIPQGVHIFANVVTLSNVTISSALVAGATIDGFTLAANHVVLAGGQSGADGGPYIIQASGGPVRHPAMPAGINCANFTVRVERGDNEADYVFLQTANGCIVDTDVQTWQILNQPQPTATPNNLLRNSTFQFGSGFLDPENVLNSVANDAYGLDGWNMLGDAGPVYTYRAAGVSSQYGVWVGNGNASSKRIGICQMLEGDDSIPLRGKTVCVKLLLNSNTASKNLRVGLLEWTGTKNSPTSDPVNSWSNGTFTAGNFYKSTSFTVVATSRVTCTSSNTNYTGTLSGTISSSCNNLMLVVTSEDTYSNGNGFQMECPGLYLGTTPPTWSCLSAPQEEQRCQRFRYCLRGQQYVTAFHEYSTGIRSQYLELPVRMRATGTGSIIGSPSWVTAGTSGAQMAFYDRVANAYASITGSLTPSVSVYSPDRFALLMTAGTSFSGTVGSVGGMDIGSGVLALIDCEL